MKWTEVDPKIRNDTAKRELQIKLAARHSTTHQEIQKAALPGTVGNVSKGLHPAAAPPSEGGGQAAGGMPRTQSSHTAAAAAASAGAGAEKPGASASFNFDKEDSSDDEEDVYGWRFDKDGDAENEKNLQITLDSARGGSSAKEQLGAQITNMRSSFSSSVSGFKQSFTQKFEPQEQDHPALKTAKSLSQFAGSTLLKTASFAARGMVRLSSKVAGDLGKYMSQDENDRVGSLAQRSDSFMKIHDLANSPTKDKVKKKRLEDLNNAIGEVRQFGEEAEHTAANQVRTTVDRLRLWLRLCV